MGTRTPAVTGASQALQRVATTGVNGYTLINGTGTVLSYTTPNDGQAHVVKLIATLNVQTTAETGGQMQFAGTLNGGQGAITVTFLSGQAVGTHQSEFNMTVGPNTTVTVSQNTALTAGGPATMWLELFAL